MNATNHSKRIYHPLVVFFYHANLLSPLELEQIPKTTLDYWKNQNHVSLFGYQWIESFYAEYDDFNKIQKRKIIYKAARLCCKLADTVSAVFSDKKGLKKNIPQIINTIDYLAAEISLKKACRIFQISTQYYYRYKNKVNCSASVLNLCYKTHPRQLTIRDCSIIKEAVNAVVNFNKKTSSIWYTLLRKGELYCSISTFYKYSNLL